MVGLCEGRWECQIQLLVERERKKGGRGMKKVSN